MRRNLFLTENKKYEDALAQATKVRPISTFDTMEGKKGIYLLDGNGVNIARTFLLSEVERKKKELERDSDNFESENL